MNRNVRRAGFIFLCALPFLALAIGSARPIRTAGFSRVVGIVLFTAVVVAAWAAWPRGMELKEAGRGKQAIAGTILIAPWAMISLMWVGLGPPFEATLPENYMRFVVLVWNSILVTTGFVVLKDVLNEAGERICSSAALATAFTAGTAYLICLTLSLAQTAQELHGDMIRPPAILGDFYNAIEFIACVMTYVTTALFATGMGRARLLGRGAASAYVTIAAILMLLIIVRGIAFPEISGNTAPWYTRPGVIAGVPAIPWVMPGLLGAVLLCRSRSSKN